MALYEVVKFDDQNGKTIDETDQLVELTPRNMNQATQIENLPNLMANMDSHCFGSKFEQHQNQKQLSLWDDEEPQSINEAEQTALKLLKRKPSLVVDVGT